MSHPATPVLADLHLLTVLAQTRSYTQAARRLGISKASVSMRIGELERAAGVPLVRRTTRSVGLTEAGQQLVDDTQPSFAHIEQSFASVRDLAGSPRGLVRVTAPVALGRQHIAPTLAAFLRRQPEIRVELDLTDRFVNLVQEGFDLAVRHAHAPPDTHVAWVLCESRSVLVASPEYLRRRGAPSHPSQLASHDCLLYLRDTAGQNWSFEREAGRKAERVIVAVNGPLKANNSEVLREAVLGGLGLGLLPDFSAAGHLRPRSLVPVLPGWRPQGFFGDRLYAIRPWAPQVPRAVQCFVDHLRETLAGGFEMPG
ncbi:LysR family transcriptional regulator [Variovorax terrae]|uniref:LysR family transcriptional regulator n=1 Tax=Variovorax terrae TaxID=2923278 RepID=A0A9X1VYU9_9BURK|nr:LysR family transcriptional regulator [Variovorax terrae]MCJ0765399.1 LysR family transcriptional regulator [Variovorax terrae]